MLKRIFSGLMLLALSSLPAAAQANQFLQAPPYSAGTNPQAVAIGDFDNNGTPDVAVANAGSNSITILLGNSKGTLTPVSCGTSCTTDSSPQGIAVGDFNKDNNLDVAVTNSKSNTISIFLGNGDGTVQSKVDYRTGNAPQGIAVADFNGDGYPDIAITNATDGTIGIFLNNQDGTVGTKVATGTQANYTYNAAVNPWAIAVGDFRNVGIQDLAVVGYGSDDQLLLFLGNGNGTFAGGLPAATGTDPIALAVGHFNGPNAPLDVAVVNGGGNSVSILVGNGKGGFAAPVNYPTAAFPTSVAVADLNGDGIPDLAVSASTGNVITVLWGHGEGGQGDGTFVGSVNCGTGNIPSAVAVADFAGGPNGQNDLVVANSQGSSVSVIINNGNETFQSRLDYAAGTNPHAVASADFNGDGIPDLAVADSNCANYPNCGVSQISILLGNGDGTFQAPNYFSTGTDTDPVAIMVGDFNQDGIPDLAVANYATSTVSIFLGLGDGTFQAHKDYAVGSQNVNFPDAEPTSIVIEDFNGDGYPDLAVTNFHEDSVSVLLNNRDGTFATAVNYDSTVGVGNGPISVAAAKLNGDQFLDLVVINETSNSATILEGNGSGGFSEKTVINPLGGGNPLFVVIGDFNGDKIPDLAVADLTTQQVSIFLGAGSWQGTGFTNPSFYSVGAYPSALVTQDFNGDGKLDLAVTSTPVNGSPGDEVSLLWGNGDGTFQNPTFFGAGYYSYSLVSADFNGDGAPDLAVANGGSNTVSILLNLTGTAITVKPSLAPSTYGQSVTLTATVAASVSNGAAPTGQVTFENGSTVIGTANLMSGAASVSTSTLPAATNSLVAIYSGDGNYQPHTVQLSQKVNAAISSVSLTSTPNPSAPNQTATFTASVSSPTTQPGGVVTFLDGSTSIGTGTLNGSGQATLSTSTLATGKHNVTAFYAGNSNITSSTSSALQQVIAAPTAPNFSLTAKWSTSNSIAPGATATALVTINAVGGVSTVNLTCTISPSTPSATCSLPSAATVANGAGTATLVFKTAGPTSSLLMPNDNHGSNMLFAVAFMIPALLLGGAGMTKPGRKKFLSFCLCLALAGCVASIACGGGSTGNTTPPPPPPSGNSGTPAGAYQVTISGSASGVTSPSPVMLPVTVQ